MKHKDVTVGGNFWTRIGEGPRAQVRVLRAVEKASHRGVARQCEFIVQRVDAAGKRSGREVQRSAAQLHAAQVDPPKPHPAAPDGGERPPVAAVPADESDA